MNLETQSVPVSPVPQLDISHHASEDLVPTPVDNAPPALDIEAPVDIPPPPHEPASPARPSLLTRLFGSGRTRQQEERHITERRRGFISDTVPSAPSEEQLLLQLQINTDAADQRMVISRMETIGGQIRADFFKSLRESAKSAVRALFADFFRRFADFVQTFFDVLQTFCRLYLTG